MLLQLRLMTSETSRTQQDVTVDFPRLSWNRHRRFLTSFFLGYHSDLRVQIFLDPSAARHTHFLDPRRHASSPADRGELQQVQAFSLLHTCQPYRSTGFSGRIPQNWTCYRTTGNFVISTGFLDFYQPESSVQKPDTSAQKHGFVLEPALKLLGR